MALQLTVSKEDYKSIGKNAINYQTKLTNQSKLITNIETEIGEVWNGKNAGIAREALQASSDAFRRMAEMINPYITGYKKVKAAFQTVYGEMD